MPCEVFSISTNPRHYFRRIVQTATTRKPVKGFRVFRMVDVVGTRHTPIEILIISIKPTTVVVVRPPVYRTHLRTHGLFTADYNPLISRVDDCHASANSDTHNAVSLVDVRRLSVEIIIKNQILVTTLD